nr:rcc01693 family protein [Faunimonas pinastri]
MLPWKELMTLGFAVLRLAPSDFWSMTPREIEAVVRPYAAAAGTSFTRAGLNQLLARFPDRKDTNHGR